MVARIADVGRDASLALMEQVHRESRAARIAVDGPLGPRHAVKRDAVELASRLGWRIYPVSVAASRKRVFPERWDRRELPRPWSRVAMVVGPPLEPPADLDGLEQWTERLGSALAATDARAAEMLGSVDR